MDPASLRALERIIAVAIGGMSILLGYRLFLALPQQRDSSGEVKLPWNISVVLARVGPGVFFALFGAAVVALSLHEAVSTASERTVGASGELTETVSTSGIGENAATGGETLSVRRLRVTEQIQFLNAAPSRSDLGVADKQAAAEQIAAIKLSLMQTVWASDWGDAGAFKVWVEDGAADPVPTSLRQAAAFYRAGAGGGP